MTATDEKARKKVWDMIKDIRTAQMVTHLGDNRLTARPMQAMNREFDGSLWYFTPANTGKVEEIAQNPHVLLAYNNDAKHDYVTLQGRAEVLDDRAKIKELWSEMARIWFPAGPDDPNLRLIRVEIERAEYWDSPSQSLVLLYGYAVARLTGETPKVGENKKVAFN